MRLLRRIIFMGLLSMHGISANCHAQGSAFTYQGWLRTAGAPANGEYEITFTLYDAVTNGNAIAGQTVAPVPVTNGLLAAALDFGSNAFNGGPRWLEIAVTVFGSDMIPTTLVPRQRITPTPYAIHSGSAGNLISVGTAPLILQVNGQRALRIEPTIAAPNLIGGYAQNGVSNGVVGAFIGGGGLNDFSEGNYPNRVNASYGAIVGGFGNVVGDESGFIGGGENNRIAPGAYSSVVVGGHLNRIEPGSYGSFLGGGGEGLVEGNSPYAVLAGGFGNIIRSSASHVTIGGGQNNTTGSGSSWSTIAGGNGHGIGADSPGASIGGGLANGVHASAGHVGGGYNNFIFADAGYSFIGGGYDNEISGSSTNSMVGGGKLNRILNGINTVIAGGFYNLVLQTGESSVIGGGASNSITAAFSTIGGGVQNRTESEHDTVAGGAENSISFQSAGATIGGGMGNAIDSEGVHSTIGGGFGNFIEHDAGTSTIAGGRENRVKGDSGTVGGGWGNTAAGQATVAGGANNASLGSFSTIAGGMWNTNVSDWATIGGGRQNFVTGLGATVPGGSGNRAEGDHSFAAGQRALAAHHGSFIWADASTNGFTSLTNNEFAARASGGVRFVTHSNASVGVQLAPGSGAWSSLSDRNAKENIAAVNPREILERVAALPLATWNYKSQDRSIRHIGPMAQDFRAAFQLGENDRAIATIDADGVALAAIQGLKTKIELENDELRAALHSRDAKIAELQNRLEMIESLLLNKSAVVKR
jgi:trimeric autotransporter adhesin